MDNLTIGNIAIATVIVGIFDLLIILLVRTETILKIIERIKGVIQLDYKSRAKRSDDEVRISKKHVQVAKERIRHSFVNLELWNCKWTWNWSDDFEPINIKGFCLGDSEGSFWRDGKITFKCNHPVKVDYYYQGSGQPDLLYIYCTQKGRSPHRQTRANFELDYPHQENPDHEFHPIISKRIQSERDLKIAEEIKKLRRQFWR